MAKYCSYPGCQTGRDASRAKYKRLGVRQLSVFKVPKNMVQRWSRAIGECLSHTDFVCELHFSNDSIIEEDRIKMPDGTIEVIPHLRHTLIADAMPIAVHNKENGGQPEQNVPCDQLAGPSHGSVAICNDAVVHQVPTTGHDFLTPTETNKQRQMLGLLTRVASPKSIMLNKRHAVTAAAKLVEVTKNENSITTISMVRRPVNGLNLPLLTDLKEAFINAQKDGSRGVVLTSSLATVFSAGLDITEMYKPDDARVLKFWIALQDAWITLYGLGVPTAVAINGSSPAGGCLLALACEYRVMVDGKHTIGLNEAQLGIVAPKWFMTNMIDTIGYRQSENALLKGKLFNPQEALKIGLIDEITADKQGALAKCHEYIESFSKISPYARAATKSSLRNERIAWLKNNRDADIAVFLNYVKDPEVQTGLGLYIEMLKQNKSKL